MPEIRTFDENSAIFRVKLMDSTSAIGAGKTGLTNTSTGLIISTICDKEASATVYTSAANHIETITTLGTYAAPSASCCRFKEVDATNHPGLYEVQLADARLSVTNGKYLIISISGATGIAQLDKMITLTGFDLSIAKQAVTLSASDVTGDLSTSNMSTISTNVGTLITGVNVTKWSGTTVATPDTAGYPKVTIKSGTGTGELSLSSGKVTASYAAYIIDKAPKITTAAIFEIPESSTAVYRIDISFPNIPDAAPTISVSNQGGTSRNINLDSTTMTQVGADTKLYRSLYTVGTGHAVEQLTFAIAEVSSGITYNHEAMVDVADDQSTLLSNLYNAMITSKAEATSVPAITSGIVDKVNYMFSIAVNKQQQTSGGILTHYQSNGATLSTKTITDNANVTVIGADV